MQKAVNSNPIAALEAGKEKLVKIQIELGRVEESINDFHKVMHQRGLEMDSVSSAARKLLDGEGSQLRQLPEVDRDQLLLLQDQRKVLNKAIELQKVEIDELKRLASHALGDERRPGYKAIVRKLAAALVTLSNCISQEREFRQDFESTGLHFTGGLGHPAIFPKIGELSDQYSQVNYFLKELVNNGHLTADEVKALKRAT